MRPDICSLDLNTMWFGTSVVINTPKSVAAMARGDQAAGVKPELEVFDSGDIELAERCSPRACCRARRSSRWCWAPATALRRPRDPGLCKSLLPADAVWAAMGIGAMEFPIVAQACVLGGHVRVGLEDNLYMSKGVLAPRTRRWSSARRESSS